MTRLNPLTAGMSRDAIQDLSAAKLTLYQAARASGWELTSDSFGVVVTNGCIRLCNYTSDLPAQATLVILAGGPLPLADYPALANFVSDTTYQEVWL